MKLITLFLVMSLLVGCSLAAQTKIDPGVQINWTKSIGSQIHGVTNGDEAQDVTTYSQLIDWAGRTPTIVTVGTNASNDYVIDGTDDNGTINEALSYASANGISVVLLENGRYNITGPVTIPTHMWLRGSSLPDYASPSTLIETSAPYMCAQMAINYTGGPAFEMSVSSQLTHMQFYYPANNLAGAYGDLIEYPATINATSMCEIGWVHPVNPHYFINMSLSASSQNNIHDITGYFTKRGIYAYYNAHGLEIRNIDFLPSFAGVTMGASVWNEVAANGTAIEIDSADFFVIDDVMLWDIGRGIVAGDGALGYTTGEITNCMFDEVPYPIILSHVAELRVVDNRLVAVRGAWVGPSHVAYYESTHNGITIYDGLMVQIANNLILASDDGIMASYTSGTINNNVLYSWSRTTAGGSRAMVFVNCTSSSGGSGLNIIGNELKDLYGIGNNTVGVLFVGCNNFTMTANTGKCDALGANIDNADAEDYIILGNSIRSTGLYNAAVGASRKVVEHNLW